MKVSCNYCLDSGMISAWRKNCKYFETPWVFLCPYCPKAIELKVGKDFASWNPTLATQFDIIFKSLLNEPTDLPEAPF